MGKALFIGFASVLLTVFAPSFGAVILEFNAFPEDGYAVLEWTAGAQAGVARYVIQRSFDGERFHEIAETAVDPTSSNYRYIDRDLFKGNLTTYYYRIQVAFDNGASEQSRIAEVILSSSGIRRTWGSIKAMFR